MKGVLVVFFTQQNRRYHGEMLGDWIVDVAKDMGLRGATLCTGIDGFGYTRGCIRRTFLSWRISLATRDQLTGMDNRHAFLEGA